MFKIKNKVTLGDKQKLKITSSYFTIMLVLVLVVANILMAVIGTKLPTKFDLTQSKVLDFSDTTISVLDNLDKDVKIYGLIKGAEQNYDGVAMSAINEIIKKYVRLSDKITYQEIDPMNNPQFLMSYTKDGQEITDYSVVVEHGDEYRVIYLTEMFTINSNTGYTETIMAEQLLTAAIVNVTSGEAVNVQVVEGHGEVLGAEYLNSVLTTDNYNISSVNLLSGDINEDTDILIMGMVSSDYITPEIDKVEEFLSKGGKLQVLTGADLLKYPVLDKFYRSWGIEFKKGVIAETQSGMYYETPYVLLPNIESSDITDYIAENKLTMIVPNAAAISVTDVDNIDYTYLLSSSPNSYLSTNPSNGEYQEGDEKGPFSISVYATRENEDGSKAEAVFSGTLFSLTYQYMTAGNQNFMSNTMSALSGKDSAMLINAKDVSTSMLSVNGILAVVIAVILTILVPLALIIYGIAIWLKRRHL